MTKREIIELLDELLIEANEARWARVEYANEVEEPEFHEKYKNFESRIQRAKKALSQ